MPPQRGPRTSEQCCEEGHCLRRSVKEAQDQDVVPSEGAAAVAGGQHLRDLGVAGQPHRLLRPPRPQDRGGVNNCDLNGPHCRASGGMAIFLGVSAAPKRILLSEFSYASVQHSLSQPESFIVSGQQ